MFVQPLMLTLIPFTSPILPLSLPLPLSASKPRSISSMGCGVSKPKIDGENGQDPAGISPIRRRIDEIKRCGTGRIYHKRSKSTLSEKQLLTDSAEEEEQLANDSLNNEDRKSVSLPTERVGSDEVTHSVPESDNKRDDSADVGHEKGRALEKGEEQQEEDEEEEEEEGAFGDGEGSELGPGSPSFREYCIPSVDNSVDSFDTCEYNGNDDGEKREKPQRKKSTASLYSSEGSVTILVKKEQRGRRFRNVLPKGGQAAVKNLLNVKSCYTPPCYTPHDNPHLLTEKSPTPSS